MPRRNVCSRDQISPCSAAYCTSVLVCTCTAHRTRCRGTAVLSRGQTEPLGRETVRARERGRETDRKTDRQRGQRARVFYMDYWLGTHFLEETYGMYLCVKSRCCFLARQTTTTRPRRQRPGCNLMYCTVNLLHGVAYRQYN